MRINRIATLAATFVALAGVSLEAQGKGNDGAKGKSAKAGKGKGHGDHGAVVTERRDRDGRVIVDRNGDVMVRRDANGRRVPPGLAKKPGQMPPGQYKKRYTTTQGGSILQDVFGRNGYQVVRTGSEQGVRYVWYKDQSGRERRAAVRPGAERLVFVNVPQAILSQVISRLY